MSHFYEDMIRKGTGYSKHQKESQVRFQISSKQGSDPVNALEDDFIDLETITELGAYGMNRHYDHINASIELCLIVYGQDRTCDPLKNSDAAEGVASSPARTDGLFDLVPCSNEVDDKTCDTVQYTNEPVAEIDSSSCTQTKDTSHDGIRSFKKPDKLISKMKGVIDKENSRECTLCDILGNSQFG